MPDPSHPPVFYDETRRRWGVFFTLSVLLILLALLGAAGTLVSILRRPELPNTSLTRVAASLGLTHGRRLTILPTAARWDFVLRRSQAVQQAKTRLDALIRREEPAKPISASAPVRAVFYVNWDKPSLDSLRRHAASATHFVPAWLRLSPDGARLVSDREQGVSGASSALTQDDQALQIARAHGLAVLPLLQNYGGDDFQLGWLHALLSSPAKRQNVIAQTLAFVVNSHFQGVNIDFETDRADDRAGMTALMTELATRFHARGLLVTQDIQLDSDAYDLPALARVADFLVPMLYDQHASGTSAGPLAAQNWFDDEMATLMAQVPAEKVVLGIGNYGYDWRGKRTDADEISFQSAAQTAQESRDGEDGILRFDPSSANPYFTYWEGETPHVVWLEDATTAWNEMAAAQKYHPRGAALWRLGTEDPSLWRFFGRESASKLDTFDPQNLAQVTYTGFGTQFEGEGDVLDVVRAPTPGLRKIVTDKNKRVTGETFETYPSQYVIRRTGLVDQTTGANTSKIIAFTFDDGPDPRWTPQILDILKKYDVPATFFVVGENAEAYPDLVQREWNAGMELGNHSFTHPEMDRVSPLRTRLELDATQRVIEALTGHSTPLFRAPNRADSEPSTIADFDPILQADGLGYLFIGEQIDPTDWKPGSTADKIVANVLANAGNGNCVLLHDAGGTTRAETVKALPQIIAGLKARGYHFVPVSALIGRTRAQVFPAVSGRQRLTVTFDRAVFDVTYWLGKAIAGLFVLAIALGTLRIVLLGALAARQGKDEAARAFVSGYAPTVSVVIAAFNEAKVVNKTIETLLASDYPDLEVLVVDDGSQDGTASVVSNTFGGDPRVSVLIKPNGGKASALNLGIQNCRGEILIALDADTVFLPDTISRLVRHFADPNVGAVSGNVKVGNRRNLWTRWQAVEYITSQNFDRRAFDLLNCITVVPGAIGAWRRDAVILAGLYSSSTLAEDTDLTFKVRRLGYSIKTDNSALAFTEAPDTLRDLAKQRFRWAFGTLQCLWKHRSALGNPRYGAFGLVGMPSLWIYQIGFQAVAPLVDLAIVWSLFYGKFVAPTGESGGGSLPLLLGYWAALASVELAGAWLAFRLDREDKKLLFWLPFQRFAYRQLMYWVIVKSLLAAMRGGRVGWGKLERKGTVTTPETNKFSAGRDEEPSAGRVGNGL